MFTGRPQPAAAQGEQWWLAHQRALREARRDDLVGNESAPYGLSVLANPRTLQMRGRGKGTGGRGTQDEKAQAWNRRRVFGGCIREAWLRHSSLFPAWHRAWRKKNSFTVTNWSPLVLPSILASHIFFSYPFFYPSIYLAFFFHTPNRVSAILSFPKDINSLRGLSGLCSP